MSMFASHVETELARARAKHGKVNSIHEGYAIILEEIDEFWAEVKKKSKHRDMAHAWEELVQIAAMCQKTAEDCIGEVL